MAVYVQPYNPWREQLAVSVLGPLLSGLIQQSQTNDRNRKLNAFGNEVQNRVNQLSTSPTLDEVKLHEMFDTDASLAKYTTPASPWASGLGQNASTNPWMTNGPSISPNWDIAQYSNLFSGAARGATTQDAQRIATELLATPRFNMLDHTAAQGAIAPMLAGLEAQAQAQTAAQQQAQKQAQIADFVTRYRGAQTPQERNALGLEMSLNGLSAEALKNLNPNYSFNQVNAGDRVYEVNRDPVTGAVNPAFEAKVGLAPDTRYTVDERRENNQGKLALGYSELEEKQRHNVASEDIDREKLNPYKPAEGGKFTEAENNALKTHHEQRAAWEKELEALNSEDTKWRETLQAQEGNTDLQLENEARRAELKKKIDDSRYQEYVWGVMSDPNSPVLRSIAQMNGWPSPEEVIARYGSGPVSDGRLHPTDTAPDTASPVGDGAIAKQNLDSLTSGDMEAVTGLNSELEDIDAAQAQAQTQTANVVPPAELLYDPETDGKMDKNKVLPGAEYGQMLADADNGKYRGMNVNSREDLDEWLIREGYKVQG